MKLNTKKIVSAAAALMLCATAAFSAVAESNHHESHQDHETVAEEVMECNQEALCGGWTSAAEWQSAADMSEHAKEVFTKATGMLMGVNYEALGLMGTQVVAGTNYCFLAKLTLVTPGQESGYAMVYVYEALDGSCSVLEVETLELGLD